MEQETTKELKILIKTIESLPDRFPDFESDDYDSGYKDAKNKILIIIKSTIKLKQ